MIEFEISFRTNGNSADYVADGWSEPEGFGRWLVGKTSRLICPPPPPFGLGGFILRTVIGPYLRPGHVDHQPLRILVNGTEIHACKLTGVESLNCDIPQGVITSDHNIEILIEHPGGVSPASIDGAGDQRDLSVSIWSMTLLGPDIQSAREIVATPYFHLRQRGNLANRMIQYMVGLAIRANVPQCVVTGAELAEWGIAPASPPPWADLLIDNDQFIDIAAVAAQLRAGGTTKISYRGYGQRMENLLPAAAYRSVFVSLFDDVRGYDERHLVINIRGGDVIDGAYRDYVLIPPNFYRDVINRTELIPVFLGQIDSNHYTDKLRAQFPDAVFVSSQGAIRDFETIRRSRNIVIAVSTFSWLAAWLSDANRIVMPVNGLFNPLQFPDVDLLPLEDDRYEFHLFPVNYAAPPDQLEAAHAAIDATWKQVGFTELYALRSPNPSAA